MLINSIGVPQLYANCPGYREYEHAGSVRSQAKAALQGRCHYVLKNSNPDRPALDQTQQKKILELTAGILNVFVTRTRIILSRTKDARVRHLIKEGVLLWSNAF